MTALSLSRTLLLGGMLTTALFCGGCAGDEPGEDEMESFDPDPEEVGAGASAASTSCAIEGYGRGKRYSFDKGRLTVCWVKKGANGRDEGNFLFDHTFSLVNKTGRVGHFKIAVDDAEDSLCKEVKPGQLMVFDTSWSWGPMRGTWGSGRPQKVKRC